MRAEKDCFSLDCVGVGRGEKTGRRSDDFFQQAYSRIGSRNAFVHDRPLLIDIVLPVRRAPVTAFDVIDWRLVGIRGALVRIISSNTAPYPVTGGATPGAGVVRTVESAIRADESSLDACFCREGTLIQRPLRNGVVSQEILAAVEAGGQ